MTIEVEEVCFSSQGKKILKDITWEVSSDDLWLLSGESGSGKTALLSIIIGTLKPDSGKVRLLGDYKYSRVNAGVCFQDDRLFKNMTAAENVAVVTKMSTPAVAAEDLVKLMDEDKINIPVSSLSPVDKRIVSIVRACFVPSDILILDDPFRGMDDNLRRKSFSYIKEVAGHKGIIIAQRTPPEGIPPLRTFKLTV
ncbi:MAG: ATP-binding cassette domain-containing protein [Lachnospiraceae bacterium]|nr:ATP-binding cassette domain-containing protein [Lachnospiraceae bacterium]